MRWSRGRLLLAGLVAAYAFYLAWYHCPYAGGADSSGYLNSARLLLDGRLTTPVRIPAGLSAEVTPPHYLVPVGFRLAATGENMAPTYPVGLPLHFAALGWLIGLGPASTVVGVTSALAFVFLLFFTAREFGVNAEWSLGLALVAALSPLVLLYALQPMSDLIATCWTLAMVLCALRSHRHVGWAAGAGAALALAVLVRPTCALLVFAAALALRPSFRTWLAFGFGGLPGALFLAGYNHALYGAILTTGYRDVNGLFAFKHVPATLWHYAIWVPVVATPLVLAAAALPWLKLEAAKKATLLAWAGSVGLFYSAYLFTQEDWWFLRFIMPILPALGISAALALQRIPFPSWFLLSRLQPQGTPAAQLATGRIWQVRLTHLLLLAAAGWMLHWDRTFRVSLTELDERTYPLTAQWVEHELPPDAVLLAYQVSGCLLYYTDRAFIVPVDFTPADNLRLDAWLAREQRPVYAALFPFEQERILERLPGRWEAVARIRQATIWRRLPPAVPAAR
jgi:hypothetical protein